jgi:geranylgeranyl pyrophosphate synthase
MHYACLNGGKRLRPLLVYLSAEIFGTPWERLHPIATAIELIHCYSLVHDDLPAMDNDELRRGKPTCHKAFNEATAILAGDALLTLAFDILSTSAFLPTLSESVILKIIKIISKAAGLMVQGQALDIAFEGKAIKLEQLIQMHRAKTGALIAASVQCGALASGHVTEKDLVNLQNFGQAIGLSFQIQDDILDRLGHPNIMGKHPGQDVKKNKCTFVTLLGLAQAQDYAQNCHEQALACLTDFGKPADPLRALSEYFVERVK